MVTMRGIYYLLKIATIDNCTWTRINKSNVGVRTEQLTSSLNKNSLGKAQIL